MFGLTFEREILDRREQVGLFSCQPPRDWLEKLESIRDGYYVIVPLSNQAVVYARFFGFYKTQYQTKREMINWIDRFLASEPRPGEYHITWRGVTYVLDRSVEEAELYV